MGMKKYRFVGLDRDIYLPDDIVVEIAIVPASVRNIRSNQVFSGQTSYTQHETANFNTGANADMHKRWLHNGAGGAYVGFNFVVDDRKIIQLTPLNEVTWHAGTPEGNKYSWGSELCVNNDINHITARKNAAALAGAILAAKGWDTSKLYQHNVWWGKDCPYLLRRDGRWSAFVSQTNSFRQAALYGSDSSAVVVSGLAKGDKAKVTVEALNVRKGSSTSFPIVTTLKSGTALDIIDGPRNADGYVWWDVRGTFGTGWVAETNGTVTHLEEIVPPAPKVFDGTQDMTINGVVFHADKRTVTSIGVNEREWASTESPIRKLHVNGAKIAVLGWIKGELVGSEDRWWVIAADGGRIWVGGTVEKP